MENYLTFWMTAFGVIRLINLDVTPGFVKVLQCIKRALSPNHYTHKFLQNIWRTRFQLCIYWQNKFLVQWIIWKIYYLTWFLYIDGNLKTYSGNKIVMAFKVPWEAFDRLSHDLLMAKRKSHGFKNSAELLKELL